MVLGERARDRVAPTAADAIAFTGGIGIAFGVLLFTIDFNDEGHGRAAHAGALDLRRGGVDLSVALDARRGRRDRRVLGRAGAVATGAHDVQPRRDCERAARDSRRGYGFATVGEFVVFLFIMQIHDRDRGAGTGLVQRRFDINSTLINISFTCCDFACAYACVYVLRLPLSRKQSRQGCARIGLAHERFTDQKRIDLGGPHFLNIGAPHDTALRHNQAVLG